MIANLEPYKEYKNSEIAWLGAVPKHWNAHPGFAAFREKQVKNKGMKENTVLSLSYGRIIVKPLEKLHGLVPDSFETYQIVNPGNIIIRSTDLQNDWTSLRVGFVRDLGIITSAYICLETTGILNPEYGYQLLHAFDLLKVFYGMGSGLRQNLSFSDFKRMPVFIPPLEEQTSIVRFLEHSTLRLERAIRAKRKVITLLQEQKQVIVQQAVTKGLDSGVALRDSGVPWLGEIPAHWDFRSFARLSRIARGASPRPAGDKRFFNGKHISWLTVGEVTKDSKMYLEKTESGLTKLGEENSVRFSAGTLVITNSGATLGVPKILAIDACANDGIVAFKQLNPIIDSCFGYYYLSTLTERLRDELKQGGTQPNLNIGIVRSITCPIPPISEQKQILEYIVFETEKLNTVISRLEREIDLLREYKTRLVADVVTGKLDVRFAAQQLPDTPIETLLETQDEVDLTDTELEESNE